MEVTANFIMIGDGQYLTDHHNRDNECLINAESSLDKSSIIQSFIESVNWDKIPESLKKINAVENAINEMVLNLSDNDLVMDDLEQDYLEFENEGYNDICLYAYLSW